jgi:hypothetical protein
MLFATVCLFELLAPSKIRAATGDNVGINSARRVSEAVELSVRELSTMQQRFGVDLSETMTALRDMEKEGFREMDKISEDRINQVGKVADEIIDKVHMLEDDAFNRINDFVKCAPQVMTQAVEESLANIRVFGIFTINYKTRADLSPANQYFAARDELLKSFHDVKPTTRVEGIIAVYGEISRLAQLAQCHYKAEPIGKELIKQSKFYSDEAEPWIRVLRSKN